MQSLSQQREKFSKIQKSIGKFFSRLPLSANGYTILSFLLVLCSFFFLIKNLLLGAFIFFAIAGFLDTVDGCVARFRKEDSKRGAYLDTIVDRYIEGIFLLGLLFLPFSELIFPFYVWIFILFFGALMTTYTKAAAKEKEIIEKGRELRVGFIQRPERIILLCFGLLIGHFWGLKYFLWIIVFLTVLTNFSALQRLIYTFQNANKKFEILEHIGDLKIKSFGKTREELFLNAMRGMQQVLRPEIQSPTKNLVRAKIRKIKIRSNDLSSLLVDFLSEINYLNEVNTEVYQDIKFNKFSDTELKGEILGQKVKSFGLVIKGITYHDLDIHQRKDGRWQATILFDI